MGIPAVGRTDRLLDTRYQLEKYIKHTAPGTVPVQSVFASPGTQAYADYIVNAAGSGWYQRDDQGSYSMVWYAGTQTGLEYRNGMFHAPASGVRVVCQDDEFKIHGYPDARIIPAISCDGCGRPIPYEP